MRAFVLHFISPVLKVNIQVLELIKMMHTALIDLVSFWNEAKFMLLWNLSIFAGEFFCCFDITFYLAYRLNIVLKCLM